MLKQDFIKIINEEIQKFDFLSNDEFLKEQENTDLLMNEDLQKQFICDSLLNRNTKIKIVGVEDSRIGGDWNESNPENANNLSIEYFLLLDYKYDVEKEPIRFKLDFYGDDVRIGVAGWSDQGNGVDSAPEGDSWFDRFEWLDINVKLNTEDGDEIKFSAFEKAPPRIKTFFIREYTQSLIVEKTLEIRTGEMKDRVQNVPYC